MADMDLIVKVGQRLEKRDPPLELRLTITLSRRGRPLNEQNICKMRARQAGKIHKEQEGGFGIRAKVPTWARALVREDVRNVVATASRSDVFNANTQPCARIRQLRKSLAARRGGGLQMQAASYGEIRHAVIGHARGTHGSASVSVAYDITNA